MNALLRNALVVAGVAIATQAAAEITFYEHEGYEGRSFSTEEQINNLRRIGLNNRASSVVVERDWWEVCEDTQFEGRCVVLRPGRYASLRAMGMNDSVSSVRPASRNARSDANPYLSGPVVAPHDFRRRYFERTFEANVTSVHAVVGPPEQRCWVEREQVVQERSNGVPGAIFGALLGGILGHQFGGGSGQDLATAGGAVAGAAIGVQVARKADDRQETSRDVQHCADVTRHARPEYWDVTYNFRGQAHRIQLSAPPGPTVTVNERGEPRE